MQWSNPVSRMQNRKFLISEIVLLIGAAMVSSDLPHGLLTFSRERQYRRFHGSRVAPSINNVHAHERTRHALCTAVYLRRCTLQFSTQRQRMCDKLSRRISSGTWTRYCDYTGCNNNIPVLILRECVMIVCLSKIQKFIYQTRHVLRVKRFSYVGLFSKITLVISNNLMILASAC